MNRKSTFSAIGGYQPFLFAIGMYFVALFFSIFICSAIFYAVNPHKPASNKGEVLSMSREGGNASTVMLTVAK